MIDMKKYLFILGLLGLAAACGPKEDPTPEPTPAGEAPKVVSTVPAANATDVALTIEEIVINYDKAISLAPNPTIKVNDQYVDEDIYVVDQSLYIPVTLQGGTKYTVKVLKPSIKDSEGNYAEDLTLSFTTASLNNFNAAAFALAAAPVDASATPETKALYEQLKEDFGSKIYSAAMAEVAWNTDNAEAIKAATGKYPVINAFDYIHLPSSPANWIDYGDITPVREWDGKGGVVAAGWHWNVPTSDGSGVPGPEPSEFQDDIVIDFDDVTLDMSWSNYAFVDSSVFEGLAAGSKLCIYYKDAFHEGIYSGTIVLKSKPEETWDVLVGANNFRYEYLDVEDGDGRYVITLDAKMIGELREHGLLIAGRNITFRAVGINHPLQYEDRVVYNKDSLIQWGCWVYLDSLNFLDLVEESQVVINYKEAIPGTQMQLLENHDGWVALANRSGINYQALNLAAGDGSVVVEVDDLSLASIMEYGLIICGYKYTLTSVVKRIPIPKTKAAQKVIMKGTDPELSFYSKDNGFKVDEALQDGTWENTVMKADLEKLAGYLKLLQDENIPVLFRPLHEASGGWFWWGNCTADDFKALWKYVFDYMGQAGVHNLLWVWTSCLGDADWYPGDEYVDIISYDWYPQSASVYHSSGKDAWDVLLSISNKKMLALSECSAIPAPENCAQDGAMWLWAMPWYGESMATPYNDAAFFNKWMGSPWVFTLPQQ